MKHYGDITKINGAAVPAVDVICGGSPCQDLSVAGKRAGLAGARSGLFMEQIRIIKEMRENERKLHRDGADESVRPRYMVWENVYGAFSSNGGEDFRAVLEETARVAEGQAVIPGLEKGRKWPSCGYILGDGWSIAWRGHDAQFWGVPQRRKRICMVADFNGQSAPQILFNPKYGGEADYTAAFETFADFGDEPRSEIQSVGDGLRWDLAESEESRETAAGTIENCTGITMSFQERARKPGGGKGILIQNERTGALSTLNNQAVLDSETVYCLQGNGIDRADTAGCNGKGWRENQSYTLNTIDRPAVCSTRDETAGQHAITIDEKMGQTYVHDEQGGATSRKSQQSQAKPRFFSRAVTTEPPTR